MVLEFEIQDSGGLTPVLPVSRLYSVRRLILGLRELA